MLPKGTWRESSLGDTKALRSPELTLEASGATCGLDTMGSYRLLPLLVLLCGLVGSALGSPETKIPDWLRKLIPTYEGGVEGDLKCYALPYGGIGTAYPSLFFGSAS